MYSLQSIWQKSVVQGYVCSHKHGGNNVSAQTQIDGGCAGVGSPKVCKPPKVCVIGGGGPCGVCRWMEFGKIHFFECKAAFAEGTEVVLVDVGAVVDVCESILG
ncbi:MAG: hypothetical protein GY928_12455 [Colwellia sp.]|nr:hypothetical protein [Colwellia sp.]